MREDGTAMLRIKDSKTRPIVARSAKKALRLRTDRRKSDIICLVVRRYRDEDGQCMEIRKEFYSVTLLYEILHPINCCNVVSRY